MSDPAPPPSPPAVGSPPQWWTLIAVFATGSGLGGAGGAVLGGSLHEELAAHVASEGHPALERRVSRLEGRYDRLDEQIREIRDLQASICAAVECRRTP